MQSTKICNSNSFWNPVQQLAPLAPLAPLVALAPHVPLVPLAPHVPLVYCRAKNCTSCKNPWQTQHYCKECGNLDSTHCSRDCPHAQKQKTFSISPVFTIYCRAVGCTSCTTPGQCHYCKVCGDTNSSHCSRNCPIVLGHQSKAFVPVVASKPVHKCEWCAGNCVGKCWSVDSAIRNGCMCIVAPDSTVFIVQEASGHARGYYGLPGGKSDHLPNGQLEAPFVTAKRELKEETGLQFSELHIDESKSFFVDTTHKNSTKTRIFVVFLTKKFVDSKIKLDPKEISAYMWCDKHIVSSLKLRPGFPWVWKKIYEKIK
jgi:8-oxo-dGTP pyrophosphatase MutT (NUDIX family)